MENVGKQSAWRMEVWLCGLALAVLIACGLYTLLATRKVKPFQSVSSIKKMNIFDAKAYEDLAERLQSPLPWMFHDHKLFVPRILIYSPNEKMVQPLDLSKTGYDSIPYSWKREYGFSVEDSNVALEDFDQDGFTNFEEFQSGTDPRDSHSSPPPILKLRLEKYYAMPFQFIFKGYTLNPDGTYDYQINVNSPHGPQTLFVKPGQRLELGGDAWEVGEFHLKLATRMNATTKHAQEFDDSELDLRRAGSLDTKKLIKGKEMDATERKVYFTSLIPDEPSLPPIAKGGVFSFHDEEYLLMNADATGATVKRLSDGKEFFVWEITKEEKALMGSRDEMEKKQ